jgi:hypothetical protein
MKLNENSQPPLFCHVHVPKTGGTTLNVLLERWFFGRFQVLHDPDPNFVLGINQLASHLARNPTLQCISTHYLRSFPAAINGRSVYYFTILRDPLDRTLSLISFIRKYFHTFADEHKRSLQPGIERMTELEILREWGGSTTQQDSSGKLLGNSVSQIFLGDSFCYDFASNRSAGETAAARLCIDTLERFLYVGDFACFKLSVRELARRLQAFGITCEVDPLPMERVSRDLRGDMRWLKDGKATVERYLRTVAVDSMIYRHFARSNDRPGERTDLDSERG